MIEHKAKNIFETLCVGCTIYLLARDYPKTIKIELAKIIKNRMNKGYFSDGTALGTIFYPYQFSCWGVSNENRMELIQQFNQGFMDQNEIVFESIDVWNKIIDKDDKHQDETIAYINTDIDDVLNSSVSNLKFVHEIDSFKFYKI